MKKKTITQKNCNKKYKITLKIKVINLFSFLISFLIFLTKYMRKNVRDFKSGVKKRVHKKHVLLK